MTDSNQNRRDTVSFAGATLDLYRHVCAFVNGPDERHRVLDSFASEGIAHGEKVMYIIDPARRANLVRRLRHLGYDMSKLLERHQCEVRTWSETYLRGGRFDQDAMLSLNEEVLGGPPPPRIRLIADMGWAVQEEDFTSVLVEYEARANYFQSKREHFVICVYDLAKFGGDVLIDVLRTHPVALIGGVVHANPYFVPMDELLEELRSRDPLSTHA